ncbi:adhesion G protein-coupled receptor L4-like isoform X6 [Oculina patagonica]
MSRGAFVFGLVLVLTNVGNKVAGEHCSSYEALKLEELAKRNCQQIKNGTAQQWLTVKCRIHKYNQYYDYRSCRTSWCQYFATCIGQSPEWRNLCSQNFFWFRNSQFEITTSAGEINGSHFRNIRVKSCRIYRDGIYWVRVFAIKITAFECKSRSTKRGMPFSGQPKWINSDPCDKLANGTKDIWYKVEYHYTRDWCGSFETCLQSRKLRNRCVKEFDFFSDFFWRNQPFTFEIISYLRDTRIQVNYHRTFFYFFAVNIIKCDSGGNANGSVISIDDDDDDDDEQEDDLKTEMLQAISTIDIENENSLKKALKVFNTTITKRNFTSTNKTVQERMEEVFLATNVLEEFVFGFARYHLNQSVPRLHLSSENVDLQVRRIFYQNESDFHLEEHKIQNFVRIPSGNFHNGSAVLAVVYKDLNKLFATKDTDANSTNKNRGVNTIIMSATIDPQPITLKQNVTLMFRNLKTATRKRDCMFWDDTESSPSGWSGQGCHVKMMDNLHTECTCNHLTHFAVLMQFDTEDGPGHDTISETDKKVLEIITYLGLTLSLIGIALTIIGYVFLTDMKGPLSQIRVSLVASLSAGQIIFLAGVGATENKGTCVAVAALVQYFLMAAFCWMLVEGIYLYLFVVKVYNVSNKMKICHGVSWGFPAIIVAMSLSIAAGKDGIQSFVSDKYCWISSANNLIWIFVSFVGLIELINLVILARVIKEMKEMQQVQDNQTEQMRLGIRACVVLVPLLGVTWLFGFLSPSHIAFTYIFVILNSTQGFSIFFFHCLRNSEIRERFKRRMQTVCPLIDKRIPEASQSRVVATRDAEVIDPVSIYELQ